MADSNADLGKIVGEVVAGQSYPVMPIPMMAQNAEWFDAGPVSFAVEARLLGESSDGMSGGGGSIHVFSGDRADEYVRFDCFDSTPHYHYVNRKIRRNVVWGYDPASNGAMPQWALTSIRDNLPGLLRSAGADDLAARVEREGFDKSVLAHMAEAMQAAHQRTMNDKDMLDEGQQWIANWRAEELGGR
jgi:hypothetical protein